MKFGAFLGALTCLSGIASARSTRGHAHRRAHDSLQARADNVVVVEAPTVVHKMSCKPKGEELECTCTNEHGQPIQCKDEDKPKPQNPDTQGDKKVKDLGGGNQAKAADPAPSPTPQTKDTEKPKTGGGFGVTYTPYRANNGPCKGYEEMKQDFAPFAGQYSTIRIYGTNCGQVGNALRAAKEIGAQLMVGIWDVDKWADQAGDIITAVNGDWGMIHSVSVGNERVHEGVSADSVVYAIGQTRDKLRNAGYGGPVVTVDTVQSFLNNPKLCEASDHCAVNIHAYFDPSTAAPNAGSFVKSQMEQVRQKVPNKKIVVTECGWPWSGNANSAAIASLEAQATALESIRTAFADSKDQLFLFASYNENWKDPYAHGGVERNWGMGGKNAPSGS